MRLEDKVRRATYRWIDTGRSIDRLRMEALFLLWKSFAPSAGLAVMIGGIVTAGMLWFARHLLVDMPLVAAILIAVEVAGIAWLYQIAYDRYWRGE